MLLDWGLHVIHMESEETKPCIAHGLSYTYNYVYAWSIHHCVHYFQSKQLLKVTALSKIIFAGDSSGSLPSHDAAYHDKLQCLKILIKKGAKSSLQDDKGRNVLHKVRRGRSCG